MGSPAVLEDRSVSFEGFLDGLEVQIGRMVGERGSHR